MPIKKFRVILISCLLATNLYSQKLDVSKGFSIYTEVGLSSHHNTFSSKFDLGRNGDWPQVGSFIGEGATYSFVVGKKKKDRLSFGLGFSNVYFNFRESTYTNFYGGFNDVRPLNSSSTYIVIKSKYSKFWRINSKSAFSLSSLHELDLPISRLVENESFGQTTYKNSRFDFSNLIVLSVGLAPEYHFKNFNIGAFGKYCLNPGYEFEIISGWRAGMVLGFYF